VIETGSVIGTVLLIERSHVNDPGAENGAGHEAENVGGLESDDPGQEIVRINVAGPDPGTDPGTNTEVGPGIGIGNVTQGNTGKVHSIGISRKNEAELETKTENSTIEQYLSRPPS